MGTHSIEDRPNEAHEALVHHLIDGLSPDIHMTARMINLSWTHTCAKENPARVNTRSWSISWCYVSAEQEN